jgi:hypothetical protein
LRMHEKEALVSNISFWRVSNPLILHNSHCNVHAFKATTWWLALLLWQWSSYLFHVHRLPILMFAQCLH